MTESYVVVARVAIILTYRQRKPVGLSELTSDNAQFTLGDFRCGTQTDYNAEFLIEQTTGSFIHGRYTSNCSRYYSGDNGVSSHIQLCSSHTDAHADRLGGSRRRV